MLQSNKNTEVNRGKSFILSPIAVMTFCLWTLDCGWQLLLSNVPVTVGHFSSYLHMNMLHVCLSGSSGMINDKPLLPDGEGCVELQLQFIFI